MFQEFHVGLLRKWPRNNCWGGRAVWILGGQYWEFHQTRLLNKFQVPDRWLPTPLHLYLKNAPPKIMNAFQWMAPGDHKGGLKPMCFLPVILERALCSYIPSLGTAKVNLWVCTYAVFTIMVWQQKISFSHGSCITHNPVQLKRTLSAIITIIVCEFLKEG
jgi:hypothetical protein